MICAAQDLRTAQVDPAFFAGVGSDLKRHEPICIGTTENGFPKTVLKLPDLDQSKSAVLNGLTSSSSQRSYDHAIREFIDWYFRSHAWLSTRPS
jgi:hypothetical protein